MFTSSSWPSLKTTCEKSFKDFVEIYKGLPTYLIVYFPHYISFQKQKQNIKQNKLNTIPSRKSNRGVSNDFTSHLLWLYSSLRRRRRQHRYPVFALEKVRSRQYQKQLGPADSLFTLLRYLLFCLLLRKCDRIPICKFYSEYNIAKWYFVQECSGNRVKYVVSVPAMGATQCRWSRRRSDKATLRLTHDISI